MYVHMYHICVWNQVKVYGLGVGGYEQIVCFVAINNWTMMVSRMLSNKGMVFGENICICVLRLMRL